MNPLEVRNLTTSFTTTNGRTLTGYGAVWDSPAVVTDKGRTFTEVVRRGAFSKAIETKGDVVAYFNHNPQSFLGRVSSGTLRLSEDAHGLRFELDLPDTATGNEVRTLVDRGDLNGASFMFSVRSGGERWDGKTRELNDLYLAEVGPVINPVYRSTSLGLRSAMPLMRMRIDLELASIDSVTNKIKSSGGI